MFNKAKAVWIEELKNDKFLLTIENCKKERSRMEFTKEQLEVVKNLINENLEVYKIGNKIGRVDL